jgi:hypothetical protein
MWRLLALGREDAGRKGVVHVGPPPRLLVVGGPFNFRKVHQDIGGAAEVADAPVVRVGVLVARDLAGTTAPDLF